MTFMTHVKHMLLSSLLIICASCSENGMPTFTVRDDGLLIDTMNIKGRNCVERLNVWQGDRAVFESQVWHSCSRYIFVSDGRSTASSNVPYSVELMFDETPDGMVVFAKKIAG